MLKTFHFPTINSTSDYVKKLLNQKETTPFLVIADEQTGGRGSHSRTWNSPKGNLYLTAAIKHTKQQQKLIPLKAGIILAKWIQENFNLKVTIKWPNDILFQGKKIAGILCEVHSVDSNKYLCLGMGINIFINPQFKENSYYESSCLNKIKPTDQSLKKIRNSFIFYFEQKISQLHSKELVEDLPYFLTPKNSLWQNKTTKEFFLDQGLNNEGYLKLKPLEKNKPGIIVGSHNEYSWCFQKKAP